jgi:hypothetical protein
MGYNQLGMSFIEFGPKPSSKPFQPTEAQIAHANLGAVRPNSRVGELMIRARNSESATTLYQHIASTVRDNVRDTSRRVVDRAKTIVQDAGPAAIVVGGSLGLSLVLAGCGPEISGGTDGGGVTPEPGPTGGPDPAQQQELIDSYCEVHSLDKTVYPQCSE